MGKKRASRDREECEQASKRWPSSQTANLLGGECMWRLLGVNIYFIMSRPSISFLRLHTDVGCQGARLFLRHWSRGSLLITRRNYATGTRSDPEIRGCPDSASPSKEGPHPHFFFPWSVACSLIRSTSISWTLGVAFHKVLPSVWRWPRKSCGDGTACSQQGNVFGAYRVFVRLRPLSAFGN